MIKKIIVFVLFCATTDLSYSQEFSCKIKGTVIGRESKEVFITPVTEDANNITLLKKGITIPIIDNKFEFELKYTFVEAYFIIFKETLTESGFRISGWFFPDTTEVKITLYSDELFSSTNVKGGFLNQALNRYTFDRLYKNRFKYQSILDSLQKINKCYTEKFSYLTDKIWKKAKDEQEKALYIKERSLLKDSGGVYTPEAYVTVKEKNNFDSIYKIEKKSYIEAHDDIYAYYCLYGLSDSHDPHDIKFVKKNFPLFKKKYPEHPYTIKISNSLFADSTIRIGGHYIDFTAPTFDGKLVTISDSVKGKVVLIDLWATWCGACRQVSKSMITVYEKYKNRGFSIIGVCGVYKNMEDYITAMNSEKYPWLNLIEYNNQNGIWAKYGAEGAGGMTILVDNTGKILSINTKAKELDEILNGLLK